MAGQPKVVVVIAGENQASKVIGEVKSQLGSLGKSAEGIGTSLKAIGFAYVAKELLQFGMQALKSGAALADMSQRTGVGAAQLSALSYAAELCDVSQQDLEKGMRKLSTTLVDAARGGREAQEALHAAGAKATDAHGKVRPLTDVLGDIADRFAKAKDGADKAALAQQIFGKSGTALIPILNQGRAGLAQLTEEAKRLGVVITDEEAAALDEFDDNLTRLKLTGEGLARQLLMGFIPALNQVATVLLDTAKGGVGPLQSAGSVLGDTVKYLVLGMESLSIATQFAAHKFMVLTDAILYLATGDVQRAADNLKMLVGIMSDEQSEVLADKLHKFKQELFNGQTPKANPIKKGGADDIAREAKDADDIERLKLKNKMDAIKLGADFAKAINEQEIQRLDELLKHELVSVEDYYTKKKALQIDSLNAATDALRQEIALQEDASKHGKTPKDRLQAIAELNRLSKELTVTTAELNRLQGLDAGGNPDKWLAQAQAMQLAGDKAEYLGQKIEQVYTRLGVAEQRISMLVSTHQITALEGEQMLNAERTKAAAAVEAMAAAYEDYANKSGDPKILANLNAVKLKQEELSHSLNQMRDSAIDALQSGFENFFEGIETGSQSATEAIGNFAISFLRAIAQMITKMLAMYAVQKLVGLAMGFFGGGASLGASPSVTTSGFPGIPMYAEGGHMAAGSMGIVGDGGKPELWIPDTPGTVVPLGKVNGRGAGMAMSIAIDARGADLAGLHRLEASLPMLLERTKRETVALVNDDRARRGLN